MTDLNALSQRLVEIRAERTALAAPDKELKEEFDTLSLEVLEHLAETGSESARTEHASMSVSKQIVPNVMDWDKVYDYIREHDAFYLLRKQLNTGPYREQLELDGEIPGTEPFEKVSLNVRKR
ncbi:MAG: hypothetical protein B0D91_10630 [Oceanospirillales bacterium LUC14_002_19_P2]|nr:MAG: hypothetical protein B0D91_10630 [Oceanospirillales bacterium LUC14_002_19_P2]